MNITANYCGCTHTHTHGVLLKENNLGSITNISNVVCDIKNILKIKEREL